MGYPSKQKILNVYIHRLCLLSSWEASTNFLKTAKCNDTCYACSQQKLNFSTWNFFESFHFFCLREKSEMDFKIGVFDVFDVFLPVFRNSKIHLIHRKCIRGVFWCIHCVPENGLTPYMNTLNTPNTSFFNFIWDYFCRSYRCRDTLSLSYCCHNSERYCCTRYCTFCDTVSAIGWTLPSSWSQCC